MAAILLFFLILISGSVFSLVWFQKKVEDTLPITVMLIILVLFFLGICNLLSIGVYLVIALTSFFYIASAWKLIKFKEFKTFGKALFSPGFVVFLLSYTCFIFLNYKKLAHSWDEFSHWADVVKAMFMLDDLATNPSSNSAFASYPPGMALFQYLLQKLNQAVAAKAEFTEWFLYFCYQVFFVAISLPLFRDTTSGNYAKLFFVGVIVFLVPTIYYNQLYTALYIDPILGILSGVAMASVCTRNNKDWTYHTYICLISCMLILMKDVGALFSVFVILAYSTDIIYTISKKEGPTCPAKGVLQIAGITIGTMLVKIIWMIELISSGVQIAFNDKIDWGNAVNVFLGRDDSYRKTVLYNYKHAIFETGLFCGPFNIEINYLLLFLLCCFLSYFVWKAFAKQKNGTWAKKLY